MLAIVMTDNGSKIEIPWISFERIPSQGQQKIDFLIGQFFFSCLRRRL